MNRKQEDQFRTYRGYKLVASNIFWTHHLDVAWQCNWEKNIYYAPTAEEVFAKVMKHIDAWQDSKTN